MGKRNKEMGRRKKQVGEEKEINLEATRYSSLGVIILSVVKAKENTPLNNGPPRLRFSVKSGQSLPSALLIC